jgi:hypothetical protein
MMKNHVIIAYYNENIDWISNIDTNYNDIYLYNKSGKTLNINPIINVIELPNIGRESHTYLYHIINNYSNLPNECIFLQGNPFDHSIPEQELFKIINNTDNTNNSTEKFIFLTKFKLFLEKNQDSTFKEHGFLNSFWQNEHNLSSCIVKIYNELYPNFISTLFAPGALFLVNKENIYKNSLEFYKKCLNILLNSENLTDPLEGHAFERLWYYIFNNH